MKQKYSNGLIYVTLNYKGKKYEDVFVNQAELMKFLSSL